MAKKLNSLLLAVCVLFCLSACGTTETNSNSTDTLSESQTETGQDENKTNGGDVKTLSDFLPEVDDFIESLKNENLITDVMKIIDDSANNRYRIEVFCNDASFQNYYINLYYNKDNKIYKVEISQYNYKLDIAPLKLFLKEIPNSLYDEKDLLNYIREKGETKVTKSEVTSYTDEGVSYVYSKTSGSDYEWVEFYVYVNTKYKIQSSTNDLSENNNPNEESFKVNKNEVSNIKADFPTIDEYISALKANINESTIGEGTVTNGKYEFYLSGIVKVTLVLNTNNEVVNASFLITGNLSNFADDVINTMGIGVSLMQPFCELCETEDFDTETVVKSIYQKINAEIEKNNYKPDFSVEYQFGDCNFLMNSTDLAGSIQFMVATGYKK